MLAAMNTIANIARWWTGNKHQRHLSRIQREGQQIVKDRVLPPDAIWFDNTHGVLNSVQIQDIHDKNPR